MRDDLADTGQVPDPSRIYWESPDVIPYGTNPYPGNWQQFFASNWTSDVGVNLSEGTTNYIYVRGFNGAAAATQGTIQLYWAKSSLLLQTSQWVRNVIKTANNSPTTAVSATTGQQVVVGADAFQWTPQPTTGGFHYCLLALVGTNAHPAPVPTGDFPNSAAFVSWLLNNPSAVQRNVTVVTNPHPPTWQQSQTFINLDTNQAYEYLFQADISQLPAGTVVSFSCSASGPQPPINATKTVPSQGPSPNWISALTQLPPGYSSSLVVTLQIPPGSPPSPGIVVDYARVTQATDDEVLIRAARPVRDLYPETELDAGLQVVLLGSCAIRLG